MIPINAILTALSAACRSQPLSNKVLIAPSLAAGHALRGALTQAGDSWFNLRVATTLSLARDIAEPVLLSAGHKPAGRGELCAILEAGITSLQSAGNFTYFAGLDSSVDLAGLLYPTIQELRLAALHAAGLDPASFVNLEKGREVIALLGFYESQLKRLQLADNAALFQAAANLSGSIQPMHILFPVSLQASHLEVSFLDALSAHHMLTILPQEVTPGLQLPDLPLVRSLAAPAAFPSQVDIFHGYGQSAEAREVLRRIQSSGIALDEATVAVTDSSYSAVFHDLSQSLNIPVTFGQGVPILHTAPAQLLQGLLGWIGSNWLDTRLIDILQSGCLQLGGTSALVRMLREERPGWGRERYERLLTRRRAALSAKPDEREEKFLALLEDILSVIPRPLTDDFFCLATLAQALQQILRRHSRTASETDGQALAALTSGLDDLTLRQCQLPLAAALERLSHLLETLRVCESGPRAGSLHVTDIHSALWQHRAHTFVVGLDMNAFPGSGLQDPVLLDTERTSLSPHLPLAAGKPLHRQYILGALLASRLGPVTLSYSSYDTAQGRAAAPAAFLLHAFRQIRGDETLDYSALEKHLGAPAAFHPADPAHALTPVEWWQHQALSDRPRSTDTLLDCHPVLREGYLAEIARQTPDFGIFDGYVGPRPDGDIPVSASALETLARCPFAYYVEYVLRLRPVEETEEDQGVWLDAAQRGSLLHDVYCTYMRRVYDGNSTPNRALLDRVADEVIEKWRQEIPPPGELAFHYQRQDIMDSLDVYWQVEAELLPRGKPTWFEYPMGLGPERVAEAGCGSADPVPLTLGPGRRFLVKGSIDRIDQIKPHTYAVWDFKTGGTWGFDDRLSLQGGKRLQYALYAWALEEHLRQSGADPQARVVRGGYVFPTEKGEGRVVEASTADRTELAQVLDILYDIIKSGSFTVSTAADACKYCRYNYACGGETARSRARARTGGEEEDTDDDI